MANTLRFAGSLLYNQWWVKLPVPDQSWKGKTVIVTGSNIGLGYEASRHFVRLGASRVILAVRDTGKGQAAKDKLVASEQCSPSTIDVWPLDLQDYSTVKAFAERCKTLDRIDAVVENAGVSPKNFQLAEGHEATITVNVISTFLLAALLLPQLQAVAKKHGIRPHLSIVTSDMHEVAKPVDDGDRPIFPALDDPATADMYARYPQSKLLAVYAARGLVAERLSSPGNAVVLNYLTPGFCHSSLMRESGFGATIGKAVLARSTEAGSRTLVHAAGAGPDTHGQYLENCHARPPAAAVVSSHGAEVQKRVWDELSGILNAIEPGLLA